MQPKDIERSLLCSIKTPDHLNRLRQYYKITPRHFPYFPEHAAFIWEYVTKYGEAPSADILGTRFPEDFEITAFDNFEYIATEFRKDFTLRSINLAIESHYKTIESDPEGGLASLINSLQAVTRVDDSHRIIVDTESNNRLEAYKLRTDGNAQNKLNWGIAPLDQFPVMLMQGQFVGLIADTKAGKSWVAMKIALQNYYEGRKVMVISPEFTQVELECRVDTLLAYLNGTQISHYHLLHGIPGIEDNYTKYLSTMNKERLVLYTSVPTDELTPTTIAGLIKQDDPDLVVIDGIYMCSDDNKDNKTSWDQMKSMCKAFKSLATQTNTALIVTNQTGRDRDANTDNARPAMANLVAGGYDFNRFVDTLVSLGGTAKSADTRQITVPLLRNGRAVTEDYEITFFPNHGDIGNHVGEKSSIDSNLMSL